MSKQTKPITIITTIQPPDAKGKRKITVSAAPDDEIPFMSNGLFADWHKLEAEAYVAVSTRAPQTVKAKNGGQPVKVTSKKKAAKKKSGPIGPEPIDESPAETAAAPVEELPVIEGDEITPPMTELPILKAIEEASHG